MGLGPYETNAVHCGDALDCLRQCPDGSVQCCVTSPPYWRLRNYGEDGQIGREETPVAYTERLVEVFGEVRRVLQDDGTLWCNLGDSFASKPAGGCGYHDGRANREVRLSGGVPEGLKPKDLVGIPWRVAFALQADGWYLRSDIIWSKTNAMPESVTDRPTKAHEYLFLLSKSPRYYYDADAIREPAVCGDHPRNTRGMNKADNTPGQLPHTGLRSGLNGKPGPGQRNKRSVWTVNPKPFPGAHFAVFPPALIEPCILAGCPEGGIVLDPFAGSGTTIVTAIGLGRQGIGFDLSQKYVDEIATPRIEQAKAMGWQPSLFGNGT